MTNYFLIAIVLFFIFLFLQSHNEPFDKLNINYFYDEKIKNIKNVNNILLVGNTSEEQLQYFFNNFKDAKIYILNEDKTITYKLVETTDIKRIKIVNEYAYDNNIITLFQKSNVLFDIIVCSHIALVENIIYIVKSYPVLLKNNSRLIIENVQSYVDTSKIIDNFSPNLKNEIFIYDNRKKEFNIDDIKIYYENYF